MYKGLQVTEPQAVAARLQAALRLSLRIALGSLESFLRCEHTELGAQYFPASNSMDSVFLLLCVLPQSRFSLEDSRETQRKGICHIRDRSRIQCMPLRTPECVVPVTGAESK